MAETLYRCPTCGRADRLAIAVCIWAKLYQEPELGPPDDLTYDPTAADVPDVDPETDVWDGDSWMCCMECHRLGRAKTFLAAYAAVYRRFGSRWT